MENLYGWPNEKEKQEVKNKAVAEKKRMEQSIIDRQKEINNPKKPKKIIEKIIKKVVKKKKK